MTTVNYETDVVAWANEQAWLVRNKKFELLDIEHIAEEIEDVGKSEHPLGSIMATMTFDTLKFVRKLESAGFSIDRAEAVADAFRDASGEAELASKRDIRELELKIDSRFEQVKGELTSIKWIQGIILAEVMALILKAFFPV